MGPIGAKGVCVIAVPWGLDHLKYYSEKDYTIHGLMVYLKLIVA